MTLRKARTAVVSVASPRLALGAVVAAASVMAAASPARAQDDVELLGRVHGTTPPPGYFAVKSRNPEAFRFQRAWMPRNPALERRSPRVPGEPPRFRFRTAIGGETARREPAPAGLRAAGASTVTGTFHFPLVLGTFSDSPPPTYPAAEVQTEFFDGPNSRYATIEEYYADISGGRIDLQGETHPWQATGLTRSQVVGNHNGLGSDGKVGLFILEILAALDDGSVDWGLYDNDGPDGVPNSGDDDGFVDILAVMHPTWGAECGGTEADERIWSHKWSLSSSIGEAYVTAAPSAGGGFIKVDDYAIQPVERCGGGAINQIGVLAHELGHGFGLPDLYDVSGNHQGIGEWGLMGSGSWGCTGGQPERPCHMSAWSKSVLGWVDVVTLDPGEDLGALSLPKVETEGPEAGGVVYRVDAGDGSGEYFLLENRQRTGFDSLIHAPGLLVWHVDPAHVADRWPSNSVNTTASHMGVWLREADGQNNLVRGSAGGNRGDAGDPFPGGTDNRAFHAGSSPASLTHQGTAAGLTILDVAVVGEEARFRGLTRYQTVELGVEGEVSETALRVDGALVPAEGHSFLSAPFEEHRIVVEGGEPLDDGLRVGFEWSDDPSAPRERIWVTGLEDASLEARIGDVETRLRVDVSGGVFEVAPGVVAASPLAPLESDGRWFSQGTLVSLEAVPNVGYGFLEWTGAVAGQGNPAVVEMSEPIDLGLVFELTYGVPDNLTVELVAARNQMVQLVAENGEAPVTWSVEGGELPTGMSFETRGRIRGVPREDGSFVIEVRAQDARGLQAVGVVELQVSPPVLAETDLTGPLLQRPHELRDLEMAYLDFNGNRNGIYDLGDFRSFLLTHPDLPEAAAPRSRVPVRSERAEPVPVTVLVVRFPGGGGS